VSADTSIGHHGLMTADQLAAAAGLLADRTRAAICVALLDHRASTIGELARRAGVAPSRFAIATSNLETSTAPATAIASSLATG